MSERNAEIVRRAQAAINRRDIEALGVLMAPECEIVPLRAALESTVFRGPDAAAKWFVAQDESWEDLSAEAEAFRHDGDWVLVLGRIRARGRSSGAALDVRAAAIWRLREGLITSISIYTNRDEALADLGLASGDNSP
jgi:ketosteroid isomerase-like protein